MPISKGKQGKKGGLGFEIRSVLAILEIRIQKSQKKERQKNYVKGRIILLLFILSSQINGNQSMVGSSKNDCQQKKNKRPTVAQPVQTDRKL